MTEPDALARDTGRDGPGPETASEVLPNAGDGPLARNDQVTAERHDAIIGAADVLVRDTLNSQDGQGNVATPDSPSDVTPAQDRVRLDLARDAPDTATLPDLSKEDVPIPPADQISDLPGAVVLSIEGTGTVQSSPAGLLCSSSCRTTFPKGTQVTLAATGGTFSGWSGACSGADTCVLTVSGDVAVTATFAGPLLTEGDRFVAASNGSDTNNECRDASRPCRTISHGIDVMQGGETLVVGDGTYRESVRGMPSGSPGRYTTIRAANDWGVLIDGSGFADNFAFGIAVQSKSYVTVRGFRVKMNQANGNNEPIIVDGSDHIRIQRCSGSYGPTTGNAANIDVGPNSSYVLIEECFAFGGARYQILVYQSDHVVVRRSVVRHDYWNDSLQCAGFTNYDSVDTVWQNNIVLDSDTANCKGTLFGGFFNENKTDHAPDTTETMSGNIVLNVKAYAGDLDWVVSGNRTIQDMVIWDSTGGYYADQGPGVKAIIQAKRMTVGSITGTYDGPNGGAAQGTGFSVYGSVTNSVTNSLFTRCHSLGVADYTVSDYNAFFANGANYGGHRKATAGAHDRCSENGNAIDPASSFRYLPRIEPGSDLKSAGESGGQMGAEIVYQIGMTGSLYGETGWDTLTDRPLWPYPNELQIKNDMSSYSGPGAAGARGFATGTSLDGSSQTLTKYVWEYLGNPIPAEIYSP